MDQSAVYKNCRLCPRLCGVDRLAADGGYCGESAQLRLAFAGLHRGEEPPLSGEGGSGTIFVTGCNLGCGLCQNWQISTGGKAANSAGDDGRTGNGIAGQRLGRAVDTDEFVSICLALQNRGAENINIVTGSHAVPAIAHGLSAAKSDGLRIPVLWNSSGYESSQTLELLDGLIDIYLPDLKTLDANLAAHLYHAPDYPQAATQAILWMLRQGRQVIIRHLILPGYLESTRAVLRWFADNAQGSAHGGAALSLMTQYTPIIGIGEQGTGIGDQGSGIGDCSSNNAPQSLVPSPQSLSSPQSPLPQRYLNRQEYNTVLGWLDEFGIEDGFCQELVTGSDWLPDFRRPNPFSSDLSVAVWHW